MNNKKITGFTLIELLVVIVIIGVLATISVATFNNYFSDSRESVLEDAVSQISMQIKLEAINNNITASIINGDGVDYSSVSALGIINKHKISASNGNICYGSGDGGFVVSGYLSVDEGETPTFFTKGTPSGVNVFNNLDLSDKQECNLSAEDPNFTNEENIQFNESGIASIVSGGGGITMLTGQAQFHGASNLVGGNGTLFTSELSSGDTIVFINGANKGYAVVDSIDNNTFLSVNSWGFLDESGVDIPFSGTSYGGLNLDTLYSFGKE